MRAERRAVLSAHVIEPVSHGSTPWSRMQWASRLRPDTPAQATLLPRRMDSLCSRAPLRARFHRDPSPGLDDMTRPGSKRPRTPPPPSNRGQSSTGEGGGSFPPAPTRFACEVQKPAQRGRLDSGPHLNLPRTIGASNPAWTATNRAALASRPKHTPRRVDGEACSSRFDCETVGSLADPLMMHGSA